MSFPAPLSVLELAPIGDGATPASALRDSIERARVADDLGFRRFWVAEHHNMPGIASSSPPVLLAAIAAATRSIRVGSGGLMLPNHAALAVAEQFGMLEALHPGRVDLGLGRAPGTDPLTARALRRATGPATADDFPAQLVELFGFFSGEMGDDHPYRHITAVPARGHEPSIWLLGSSGYSAEAAGYLGLPFSFAHHFSAANTLPALARYREVFRPSTRLEAPHTMIAVGVVCAETDDEAQWLAGPSALSFLRLRSGRPGPMPTPEEAAAHIYTATEQEMIRSWTASRVIGDPEQVRAALEELQQRTGADELMITTMLHGHDHTVRSHELVAEALGIQARDHADINAATMV